MTNTLVVGVMESVADVVGVVGEVLLPPHAPIQSPATTAYNGGKRFMKIKLSSFVAEMQVTLEALVGYKEIVRVTRILLRYSVAVLFLLTVGCSQPETSVLTPAPSPPAVLVPLTGTLQPQGTNTYQFTLAKTGYVEVTLIGIGPPPTVTVGLGIGTPTATEVCSVLYKVTTQAGPTAQIVGTGLAGPICVTISDVGNLSGPVIYAMTVAHP